MGMFDTVNIECPNCKELTEFQSKAGECSLITYTVHTAPLIIIADINKYSMDKKIYCKNCGKCITIKVKFSVTMSCE